MEHSPGILALFTETPMDNQSTQTSSHRGKYPADPSLEPMVTSSGNRISYPPPHPTIGWPWMRFSILWWMSLGKGKIKVERDRERRESPINFTAAHKRKDDSRRSWKRKEKSSGRMKKSNINPSRIILENRMRWNKNARRYRRRRSTTRILLRLCNTYRMRKNPLDETDRFGTLDSAAPMANIIC